MFRTYIQAGLPDLALQKLIRWPKSIFSNRMAKLLYMERMGIDVAQPVIYTGSYDPMPL